MNAHLRTLSRTAGHEVTSPVRETGSSALDRRATWAAPDPSTMVLDASGAPVRSVIGTERSPWPAPDAAMRVEHPPPVLRDGAANAALVEPFHPIDMPDVAAVQRSASTVALSPAASPWPPPTLADAAVVVLSAPPAPKRSGAPRRFAVGLAAAAGVACAAAAAAVALL